MNELYVIITFLGIWYILIFYKYKYIPRDKI